MDYVDLHIHTTASDGSLTPSQVVRAAREKGLKAIAITDHDTVDGCQEAIQAGKQLGLEVIPGVEISADWPQGTMHILGYFPLSFPSSLDQKLQELKESRKKRNAQMFLRLQELGLEITEPELARISGGGQLGRPHFARALLEKGYVKSMQEAFDRYLKKGAPAYVEKFRLPPASAVQMIRDSGGIPVLAHPTTLFEYQSGELPGLLSRLTREGLMGMEVYYYSYTESDTAYLLGLCSQFGLLNTGGTDFHGENLGNIEIGIGAGNLKIPFSLLEKLKNAVPVP